MFIKYIGKNKKDIVEENDVTNWNTYLVCTCDKCGVEYERLNAYHIKMKKNPLCDLDYCKKCWTGILSKREDYRNNMSIALKLMRKNNPELSIRISNTFKERGINQGDKNGMKQKAAREKVSITRKKLFEENPELKKLYSDKTRQAWADGKFDGVRVGQCKWFDYKDKNGDIHKVQGTWELGFIKWLDENNFSFKCHRGRIPYKLNDKNKNYYPDFWVKEWDCYVDVKCLHFYNEDKFKAIKECNKDIEVKILFKDDLLKLGVNL